ncbi:hypothetical protein KUCAC02_010567, partial [Chaenocephalus aceratus]
GGASGGAVGAGLPGPGTQWGPVAEGSRLRPRDIRRRALLPRATECTNVHVIIGTTKQMLAARLEEPGLTLDQPHPSPSGSLPATPQGEEVLDTGNESSNRSPPHATPTGENSDHGS